MSQTAYYYCMWLCDGLRIICGVIGTISFLGHVTTKVWVSFLLQDLIWIRIYSVLRSKRNKKELSGQKKVISKNELWDKFKGIRITMEIRMKSTSDHFQGWRFRASGKDLKRQILHEIWGRQPGLRIRSTTGIKWKVKVPLPSNHQ